MLVLAGGYGATLVAGTADERAGDRAASLLNPLADESVQTRFDTWEASLDKVVDEPLEPGSGAWAGQPSRKRTNRRRRDQD